MFGVHQVSDPTTSPHNSLIVKIEADTTPPSFIQSFQHKQVYNSIFIAPSNNPMIFVFVIPSNVIMKTDHDLDLSIDMWHDPLYDSWWCMVYRVWCVGYVGYVVYVGYVAWVLDIRMLKFGGRGERVLCCDDFGYPRASFKRISSDGGTIWKQFGPHLGSTLATNLS